MKLKFTTDGFVNGECVFKAGETYEVPVEGGSAARWIKRGAIEVTEEGEPVAESGGQEGSSAPEATKKAKPEGKKSKPESKKSGKSASHEEL